MFRMDIQRKRERGREEFACGDAVMAMSALFGDEGRQTPMAAFMCERLSLLTRETEDTETSVETKSISEAAVASSQVHGMNVKTHLIAARGLLLALPKII
jgi:hypothetical protein